MILPVVWNSMFHEEEPREAEKVVTVVFTCKPERCPVVYDVSKSKDVDEDVACSIADITSGCNYHYKFVKKVGNVYFYK